MAIRNPYANVDWSGEKVPGLTHAHGTTAAHYNDWIAQGYKHLAPTNYYPSDPARTYPLTNITGIGAIPDDVIGGAGAEHHSFTDMGGHVCAFGSLFASGTPNPGGTGYEGPWRDFVDDFVSDLLFPEAGGLIFAHPKLSFAGIPALIEALDYSPYVLGIEVYSHLTDWNYGINPFAYDAWHAVLATGRRCWGVGVPDHRDDPESSPEIALGRNMLLVPSSYATMSRSEREQSCLEAYYEGRWYVAVAPTSPELVNVTADADEVSVEFAESCDIKFVYALPGDAVARESATTTGTSATYTVRGDEVYVRAVGTGAGEDEISLTQPIMFMDAAEIEAFYKRRRQRRFMVLSGS